MRLNSISASIAVATCTFILTSNIAHAKISNISSVIYGHAPVGTLHIQKIPAPGGVEGKLQPGARLMVNASLTDEDGDEAAPYVVQYQWVKIDKSSSNIAKAEKDGWKTFDNNTNGLITVDNVGHHIVIKFIPTTLTGVPNVGIPKYWSSAAKVIDGDITEDIDNPSGPIEPVYPSEGNFNISVEYVSGDTLTKIAATPGLRNLYPKDASDLNPIVGSVWKSTVTCDANVLPSSCTPDNFTYQWKIETEAGAVNATGIGSTTDSYTILSSDQGKKVFVEVIPKLKTDTKQ